MPCIILISSPACGMYLRFLLLLPSQNCSLIPNTQKACSRNARSLWSKIVLVQFDECTNSTQTLWRCVFGGGVAWFFVSSPFPGNENKTGLQITFIRTGWGHKYFCCPDKSVMNGSQKGIKVSLEKGLGEPEFNTGPSVKLQWPLQDRRYFIYMKQLGPCNETNLHLA